MSKQLLSPHTRFSARINHQALFVPVASNNTGSKSDRYLKPWSSFPMIKEVFIENVAKKCQIYYSKRPEEFCPPPILRNEHLKSLPYMKIVHAHYSIIRQFVCRISLRIDPEDWCAFAEELNKHLPGMGYLPVSLY